MIPIHFIPVDVSTSTNLGNPTLKSHQAIGVAKGQTTQVFINNKEDSRETLFLRRIIELTSRSSNLKNSQISQIKVRKLTNGNFKIKIECSSKGFPNRQISYEKTTEEIEHEMQEEILPLAEQAYDVYKHKMPAIKENLNDLFSSLGTIQIRVKTPVSAANRLVRALKIPTGPLNGINNKEEAINNLWDSIGSRLIVSNASESEMQKVTDVICEATRHEKLKITRLNNLRGIGGIPYFTDNQIDQIRQADAEKIINLKNKGLLGPFTPMKIGNEGGSKSSPFTCVCAYVEHGEGIIGEFQIIGPQSLKLADAEHLPYDAMINKDLYRELTPEGKTLMEPYFEPFLKAMKGLSLSEKKQYNEYLNQAYIFARKKESAQASQTDTVLLPQGFDSVLSIKNILAISEKYEETKKTMKKNF